MTSTATHSRMLEATRPDPWASIPLITVRCVEPNAELAAFHRLDRNWAETEWEIARRFETLSEGNDA